MTSPPRYAALQAEHPGIGPYMIGLLYRDPPSLDADVIEPRLRAAFGKVDRQMVTPELLSFGLPDQGGVTDGGKRVPYLVNVARAGLGDISPSLAQSWDWDLARDVTSRARHALVVSDMLAIGKPRHARVDHLDRLLRAVMLASPPLALHWLGSERVVEPTAFLATTEAGEKLTKGFVNVRLFRIEGGTPDEFVMDTLGLASFGLPDIQCHFAGLDLGAVGRVLFTYANYVFERGDVLADGNTVEGTVPGSKWRCRHENALLGPARMVVDLHPGVARPG